MEKNRTFFLTHSSVECLFSHTVNDFFVEEVPLYDFTREGEHLIIKVRKKSLTTWQLLDIISSVTGCKVRDIGYAGLKDKEAITIQFLSINRKYEEKLDNFVHPKIKIVEKTYHKNKIKLGHLKGNIFFIRLKKVLPAAKVKIEQAIKRIKKEGSPNFFGYQRFGNDGDNHLNGEKVLNGELKVRPQLKKLFINAYQSALFNNWLSRRIELCHLIEGFGPKELEKELDFSKEDIAALKKQKGFFKILKGDIMSHYPYGRLFYAEDLESESDKFAAKGRVPTGMLVGKTMRAENMAKEIEKEYDKDLKIDGGRRFAWIFPEFISNEYIEEEARYELKFFLPKGSYATVLIEELLHREL